jgi:hypothetical protein
VTRRTCGNVALAFVAVPEPTVDDIQSLVGAATPHFAYQIRARVEQLIAELPEDHPVRRYGEEQLELLDRLGYASSKAAEGERVPRTQPGWREIPSSAPADKPLPR